MNKGLLILILSFYYLTNYGQSNNGFAEGIIITKQGDTIKCQVEMANSYGSKITYKMNSQAEEITIAAKNIKSLTTPFRFWENIQIGKKERLMSLIIDGKAKLFTHMTIYPAVVKRTKYGEIYMCDAPIITYVIEQDGVYYKLTKANFKKIIERTFVDCKSIVDKVITKVYKFEDLEKIIDEYNTCK
jgi:hypothetical protein